MNEFIKLAMSYSDLNADLRARVERIEAELARLKAPLESGRRRTPRMYGMMTETLGRFGHHPDPACDFCVEVEVIEGMDYDVGVGAGDRAALRERISRAMEFVVGGDEIAVKAKAILRTIDEKYRGEDKR